MHSPIATAAEARAVGARRYFTGKPCKSGHVAERWTAGSLCVECHRQVSIRLYERKADAIKARVSEWVAANPERVLQNKASYRERNRVELAERNRDYHRRNPHMATKHAGLRRALKKTAQPPWVREMDLLHWYEEAQRLTKETGTEHSVDHIVPLKHPLVCGLHVPWNLQVMTLLANKRKGNRFEVT